MLGDTGSADCSALQTMSIFVSEAAGSVGIKAAARRGPSSVAVCSLSDES